MLLTQILHCLSRFLLYSGNSHPDGGDPVKPLKPGVGDHSRVQHCSFCDFCFLSVSRPRPHSRCNFTKDLPDTIFLVNLSLSLSLFLIEIFQCLLVLLRQKKDEIQGENDQIMCGKPGQVRGLTVHKPVPHGPVPPVPVRPWCSNLVRGSRGADPRDKRSTRLGTGPHGGAHTVHTRHNPCGFTSRRWVRYPCG